jgi:hypothetical protein
MRSEIGPCKCGAGTMTNVMEMDDWNRTRSSTEIHCPACEEKRFREREAYQARESRRAELLRTATQLATDRYLQRWLALFAGMSKKAAWKLYTGGSGYPALGTFYQHVIHSGSLSKYMEWCFPNDLEKSLRIIGAEDKEIETLLKKSKSL